MAATRSRHSVRRSGPPASSTRRPRGKSTIEHVKSLTEPAYPAARLVAPRVQAYFARHRQTARAHGAIAPEPDSAAIEAIVDAGFWASLRREEGYSPKISLAFVAPGDVERPLTFA